MQDLRPTITGVRLIRIALNMDVKAIISIDGNILERFVDGDEIVKICHHPNGRSRKLLHELQAVAVFRKHGLRIGSGLEGYKHSPPVCVPGNHFAIAHGLIHRLTAREALWHGKEITPDSRDNSGG